ncbi:12097_t:CDS:2 [Racocetra fulgida]|uniref:12097_t:CDS:1 n=1 Tax=Racocetra fulgida TaxID=60492 RepID=A0A9N8ZY22_9GLOM|nr:12097_t:CDS:2 [Racocetra fulgida]
MDPSFSSLTSRRLSPTQGRSQRSRIPSPFVNVKPTQQAIAQQSPEEEEEEETQPNSSPNRRPNLNAYGVPSRHSSRHNSYSQPAKQNVPSNLNDKIRVCVRKRPLSKKELTRNEKDIATVSGQRTVLINEPNGKTYTMLDDKQGLYVLAARDIFNLLQRPEYSHLASYIGFYEIYQGQLYDLLNQRKKLFAREDGKKNVVIAGLQEYSIDNVDNLMQVFDYGNTLSFIDLAGSERGADRGDADKQTRVKELKSERDRADRVAAGLDELCGLTDEQRQEYYNKAQEKMTAEGGDEGYEVYEGYDYEEEEDPVFGDDDSDIFDDEFLSDEEHDILGEELPSDGLEDEADFIDDGRHIVSNSEISGLKINESPDSLISHMKQSSSYSTSPDLNPSIHFPRPSDNNSSTFTTQEIDDFLRRHRSALREVSDTGKQETKLLANFTLKMNSNSDMDGSPDITVNAFEQYLDELDALLESKEQVISELRRKISQLWRKA